MIIEFSLKCRVEGKERNGEKGGVIKLSDVSEKIFGRTTNIMG